MMRAKLSEIEEQALIRAFVSPNKQERYLGFIANPKRRDKFLQALHSFNDFDRSCEVAIPPTHRTSEGIAELLKARGAHETCYVVSIIGEPCSSGSAPTCL